MPGRRQEQGDIHTTKCVIDGCNQQGVSGKEESRQGQGRVLWQGNLFGGTIEFKKRCSTNHPFGHWCPLSQRECALDEQRHV